MFLDETLIKEKDSTPSDSNSRVSNASTESDIEPHQPGDSTSIEHNSSQDVLLIPEEREEEMHEFEIDDSESATDSEYDATSDTELIQTRNPPHHSIMKKRLQKSYKKCLEIFSLIRLARKVMQRLTDCIGGLLTCVMCLWSYNYSQCKPHNIGTRSSDFGKVLANGLWRTFKLLLDRKVFVSISLYGAIAFLAIISNEVSRL